MTAKPTAFSEFPARYDRPAKIVTTLVCALLLGLAAMSESTLVSAGMVLIVCVSYAFSPRSYSVSAREVMVRRLIGAVRLGQVRGARRVSRADLSGSLRLWASGGVFGYFGLYRSPGVGNCWWYLTDRSKTVLVTTDSKTALVSPTDPDEFLRLLHAPGADHPGSTPSRPARSSLPAFVMGGLAIAIVAAAFLYNPGPPSMTLNAGTLEIHDRFYPVTIGAKDVDVAGIRVVDVGTDNEWRPAMRVNGFANSNYKSGWFRVASGARVRMYRSSSTRLVLLPGRNGSEPVLIEVAQPDEFSARLRREWQNAE